MTATNGRDGAVASRAFDVAVLGGGSAAETLVAELAPSGCRVVVFEPSRVGGICPYVACMPTKAMLHDAASGHTWSQSIRRRSDVVEHLDDTSHARELEDAGVVLVRAAAQLADAHSIDAGGDRYDAEHIVIATGAEATVPPISGLSELGEQCWTSADAMVADELPLRLTVVGGGVIGCELATIFAGFGTEVHLLDTAPNAFPDLPPEIGVIVDEALERGRGPGSARNLDRSGRATRRWSSDRPRERGERRHRSPAGGNGNPTAHHGSAPRPCWPGCVQATPGGTRWPSFRAPFALGHWRRGRVR